MPRPCLADHPRPSPDCRLCLLYATDPAYRTLWDGQPPPDLVRQKRPACVHQGGPTGETRQCKACGGKRTTLKVLGCALYGGCMPENQEPGLVCCRTCPDYQAQGEVVHPPRDLIDGVPDPIPAPPQEPVPGGWPCRPDVRDRHQAALGRLLQADFPPAPHASGEGVIYCGGGRYWPMIVAAVRMLRDVSDLPVQVWHRGEAEPIDPLDLADLPSISFHDATAPVPGLPFPLRKLGGWEQKTVALLGCGLERAVYLDADAYALADPRALLALARHHRFVYWSDLDHTKNNIAWKWYGIDPAKGQAIPQVQGGQLAFDLVAFRRELVLAHWGNQHSDYTYHEPTSRPQDFHGYGDQDQWRVALALTGGKYLHLGPAPWVHPGFVCSVGNVPMVVHRPQGKAWGEPSDKRTTHLPGDGRFWAHMDCYLYGSGPAEEVFGRIYRRGLWGHGDASGGGSTIREAQPFLDLLNGLILTSGWRSVADLGSGDGVVTRGIQALWVTGVDCHLPHVERLQHEGPGMAWLHLDLDRDRESLPGADVGVLRDVLHHWPSALVASWLAWARASGKWKWLLLCQDAANAVAGADTPLGGYRPLRAGLAPLDMPGLRLLATLGGKDVYLLRCD